jgi:hypothetical protein
MMEMHGVSAMMVTWIVLLHRQGKARQGKVRTSLFVDVHGEQPGSELNSRRGAQPASQCSGADSEDLLSGFAELGNYFCRSTTHIGAGDLRCR